MRIVVNGIELNCDARFQMKYAVTDTLSATGGYSTEITLPPTANNLRAFGLNDNVTNEDDIFNFQTTTADENGVDLGIEKSELISINPFIIRIYGTNSNVFNQIKGKLSDLDWTDLDHVWSSTNIIARIKSSSGYCYPVINYGILDTVTNNIQCSECYPAIFVSDAIERMLFGHTLNIELGDEYNQLILPYSNEQPFSMTREEKDLCGFDVYNDSGQILNSGSTDLVEFDTEVTDIGGNFASHKYTAPYDMLASFRFITQAKAWVEGGASNVIFKLFKNNGSEVLLASSEWNFNDTYFDVVVLEFQETFPILAGEDVYIKAVTSGDNVFLHSSVDENGDGYTAFKMLDITDGIVLGFTWRVGLNLPNITQATLLEYVLNSFGAIIQANEATKTIYITKLDTIRNAQGEDWTNKIDLSSPIKRTFDMAEVGKKSTLAYLEDDNVTKPTGTDYTFDVNSDKIEAEKTIYTAPFAACMTENKFSFGLPVVNIEVDGESACKPRILMNRTRRLSENINYQVDYSTVGIAKTAFVPYFYDITKTYDLTWIKLAANNLTTKIEMIQNPRGIECLIKLNAIDINQLEFRTPKWIGTVGEEVINAWFFVSEVNYDTHESSYVKLKLLNG
jgi:hypothetical protein